MAVLSVGVNKQYATVAAALAAARPGDVLDVAPDPANELPLRLPVAGTAVAPVARAPTNPGPGAELPFVAPVGGTQAVVAVASMVTANVVLVPASPVALVAVPELARPAALITPLAPATQSPAAAASAIAPMPTLPAARPTADAQAPVALQPVAQQPVTPPRPATPLPVTPEFVTPLPVAQQPVAPPPATPMPVAPQPVAPQPVAPIPVVPQPVAVVAHASAIASAAPAFTAASRSPAQLASTASPTEYGRTGAVVPSGTVLTVGQGGAYANFAAALAAAHDGDTINLPAGTYPITPTTIAHKLIISGVGGLAHFTAASASGDLFVTTADTTFRNVEISGAAIPAGVAAGIHDEGGNFTLVNSYLHDNQAGLIADPAAATSVGIYDTEIARNGTPDGRGAGVNGGGIGLLTLRNDWLHDDVAGPELRSVALATVIDSTRISQAAGNGAADVALPASGRVSITGSALEKGPSSQPTPLIDVGGQAALANSSIDITGTTFISDLVIAPTRFVVAEPGAGPVSIGGSTFVGGTAGSTQAVGASNTGAQTATNLAISPVPPWTATSPASAQAAPPQSPLTVATAPATTTQGYLVLRLSEDAFRGDAQFNLYIDGVQTADVLTATAHHGAGESQSVTVAGAYTDGPHTVQIKLLNSLQGPAPGQGRTLYLDGMALNGDNRHQTATLTANGTATLTTGAITSKTEITANVSEDAYKGDAQAFIAIDGALIGGLQTVTAAHAGGAAQAMRFLLDLAPGAHTMALTYLNDAHGAGPGMDRNLYLDSLEVAGQHVAGATASLLTNGTKTFAFNVAPPPAANGSLFVTVGSPQPASMLPTLG